MIFHSYNFEKNIFQSSFSNLVKFSVNDWPKSKKKRFDIFLSNKIMEYLCFCFKSDPNENGEYIKLMEEEKNKTLEETTIKLEMKSIFEDLENLISKPF